MRRTGTLPLLVTTWILGVCAAWASGWQTFPGAGRWKTLDVPATGHPGFAQLTPDNTGIQFTNTLEPWSSAANRVLENGSGVAVGDYDGDGRLDLFLCGLEQPSRLFRNLGRWRFVDVTAAVGIELQQVTCRGAVLADLDGDRDLDLLVSTLASGVKCFRNQGDGRFVDETNRAGTASAYGSTTLALGDIDGNGTLDLYVANYRAADIRDQARVEVRYVNGKPELPAKYNGRLILTQRGLLEFGEPDILYLNDGQGRFTAVSWAGGGFRDEQGRRLAGPPQDWGLTATFRDLNRDGAPDLYVCNDYWSPDRMWINDGRGGFRAVDRLAIRHTSENSMGVDFTDLDWDGQVDGLVLDMLSRDPELRKRQVLAQTPMSTGPGEIENRPQIMRNVLFKGRGDGTYAEIADYSGLAASDWSWQPLFVDVDLDGYDDVLIPAGHRRDVQDLDATERIRALQHPWSTTADAALVQRQFTREMMEHARLYPELLMPVIAFHSAGNLRFRETTAEWGLGELGVHQGIAVGDLDGDGDLDVVVNNLDSACGVYRNETAAPRIAVRLRGRSPNTQGIGALVTLRGGAVPRQTREMVCGGRYLSGSEALLIFAAGSDGGDYELEVRWRSGNVTAVSGVQANRLYEIDESSAVPTPRTRPADAAKPEQPWFEDVSSRLNHQHHEVVFDDFVRQPLLSRRLSQLGPGVAWCDWDADGDEDVVVGSGAGGRLGLYRNEGQGTFQRVSAEPLTALSQRDQTTVLGWFRTDGGCTVLVGSANYEDGAAERAAVFELDPIQGTVREVVPADGSSVGALALADLEGDGDLDLFVGGRVVPGRYPEPASSRVFRREASEWQLDPDNTAQLEQAGLVSGAIWSDLDGDGLPELLLACEWGPIRVYRNQAGRLEEATEDWGLDAHRGWWAGISTGDFNGDGRLDIVAGNWGLNSPWRASAAEPLRLFYGDLAERGIVDLLETEYDPSRQITAPYHRLDTLTAALPMLRELYPSSKSFSETTVEEVLSRLGRPASEVTAMTLETSVFLNLGDRFEPCVLPPEAQWAPVFGTCVADYDGDGCEDIFLSQNFFAQRWDMHRLDAGRGLWLRGDGHGHFTAVPGHESGVTVYGEQRGAAVADFDQDGRVDLLVSQNAAATRLFHNRQAKPGLQVRLRGPAGNPTGVGALVRLRFGERWGAAREVQAGSGYWSQNSTTAVLGCPQEPTAVWVRWPDGQESLSEVPKGVDAVRIHHEGRGEQD